MKKINYFFAAAMVCLTVAACVKENINDNQGVNIGDNTEEVIPDNYIELTFQTPGMDVKTSVNGNTVSWTAGDRIRICWEGGSSVSSAVVLEEGNASFTAKVAPEATDFYAVYPSTIEATVAEGNFNVTIPSSQSGRFADADIIVAKTSMENLAFAFHHAVSLVKFVISEENEKGISRAQFVDLANNSQLTGALSIAFDANNAISTTVVEKTTEEINAGLDVIDVTAVQPGDNYMAVLPSKSLAGFGLRLGSESKWYSGLVSETPVVVERLPLGTVDTRIHEGDFYITPDGGGSEKNGKSWETAYPASMLNSLIHNQQTSATGFKSLARGWRIDGKTIYVAEGTFVPGYICSFDGYTDGDDNLVTFTLKGGYKTDGTPGEHAIIGSDNSEEKKDKRGLYFFKGVKATIDAISICNNSYTQEGSAIFVNGCDVTIQNCHIEGNTSTKQGGALYITGQSNVKSDNTTYKNNSGTHGGAIRVDDGSTLTITGCNFISNSASSNGGAIVAVGYTYIASSTFDKNTATGQGGAIWNAINSVSFAGNNTISNNEANYGGGLFSSAPVNLFKVSFVSNTATINGGAIYASSTTISADRCKFIGNRYTTSANQMSSTIRIGGNSMFNACEFWDINSSNKGSSRITYNLETKFSIGMHNCLFFGESGLGHWSLYSKAPVYLINSTLIDTTTDAVLRSDDAKSLFYNNIVINKTTGIPALYALTAASHKYNIVSGFKNLAQNNTEVICSNLPDGEAKTYETMDNGMSYYSWSGSINGFNKTTKADVADAFKNDENFGKAFYAWLDELVEGEGTALDYDIRGIARTNGYWPGSYQNN